MFSIPILSRLKWSDYQRISLTLVILVAERITRVLLYFVPFSIMEYFWHFCFGDYSLRIFRYGARRNSVNNSKTELESLVALNSSHDGKFDLAKTLDIADMIQAHGYGLEEHTAFTKDGFLLILHRIVPKPSSVPQKDSKTDIQVPCLHLFNGQIFADQSIPLQSESGVPADGALAGHPDLAHHDQMAMNDAEEMSNLLMTTPEMKSVDIPSPSTMPFQQQPNQLPTRQPVFLMHGCMMTSEVWLCHQDKSKCIALALYEAGYDVWMGNRRANKYSHKHTSFNQNQEEYWNFSLDEPIIYDIPAMIDYVIATTGVRQVSYVGFSQGSAEGLAALSLYPALNEKINMMVALAATSKPRGLSNSLVRSLMNSTPELIYLVFGRRAFISMVNFWREILSAQAFAQAVDKAMKLLFRWTSKNINETDKVAMYQHLYSFTSVKQVAHWFQIMRTGRFQMYDERSWILSRNNVSLQFPLGQISAPVALFHGGRDTLCDVNYIVERCASRSIVHIERVNHYEHLDFLWASDIDVTVLPQVLQLLQNARPGRHQCRKGQSVEMR